MSDLAIKDHPQDETFYNILHIFLKLASGHLEFSSTEKISLKDHSYVIIYLALNNQRTIMTVGHGAEPLGAYCRHESLAPFVVYRRKHK